MAMDATTLSKAMSNALPMSRYQALVEGANTALRRANCTSVNRAAMFLAQLGHESVGLRYTEEIHDGSNYEGRPDLGNTQPGDGKRYKGRSFIQITGRHNYTQLSAWCHAKGYVPTPTFFRDNPARLAEDRYAWDGAVWYWLVARPQLNSLADARDLIGATRAINGGLNGLEDRRFRWGRCLDLGRAILPTAEVELPVDRKELEMLIDKRAQRQARRVCENALHAVMQGGNFGWFNAKRFPVLVKGKKQGVLDRIYNLEHPKGKS